MAENLVQEIDSQEGLDEILKKPNLVVIHFFAEWASECQPMNEVLETLAKEEDLKGIIFAKLPAETFPKISIQYKISAVPTFLFFLNGNQIDRLDGANAVKLTQMVKNNYEKAKTAKFAQIPVLNTNAKPAENLEHVSPQSYNQYLKKLINQSPIMLFMKGNAENPQCGFSRQAIALLKGLEADFGTFDILKDEKVRQELKVFSNWPTYPQLYINGELIGGLDIMKEMVESGDLKAMVKAKSSESGTLEERLKQLINRAPLMVFMKGDRVAPRCGFSRQLIEILNETKLAYDTFDILTDEEVRQGLKTFSNWPTYPQIYAKGNLVGGLDIIKELREGGELLAALKGE